MCRLRQTADAAAVGHAPPVSADTAADDVARGHRALSKRRHRRMAGLAGWVAVVAGVSVAVTLPAQGSGHRTPTAAVSVPAAPKAPASAGDPNAHLAIRLTAYTGAQPAGFTVSTVPAGWKIVSSDDYSFVLAPPGTPPAPSADGQGVSFIGRIVVMLQGDSTLDPHAKVTMVTVNGKAGQLALADGGDAKTSAEWLIYPDAKGNKILIQVPVSLGLSDAQIVRFAEGVSVTSAARAGVG